MIFENPFAMIAAVLALAAGIGALGLKLRQPLVIAFLLTGVLVGPSGVNLIHDHTQLSLFASMGIAILLFVVGLRLDVSMIRTVGPVALAVGLGQLVFTFAFGWGFAWVFGMTLITALYVSMALTFSSTIIIVKLLSDKKEIDSLYGRITVGILIVQDIAAVLALVVLTAFGGERADTLLVTMFQVTLKGVAFLGGLAALMRWVIPGTLVYIARSPELLALAGITWAVALALLSELLGFSKEVGAFLAGVSLASTEQRDAMGARLVVLRDFLLLFFFIDLGARLNIGALGPDAGKAILFSLFVLIGKPLIVMAIMGGMGYRKRTGFMCGLALAQISEFSLILAALGVRLGHLDAATMNLITMVGILTFFVSSYLILDSGRIYAWVSPIWNMFERRVAKAEPGLPEPSASGTSGLFLLLGLGSYGTEIARHLRRRERAVMAVDFDPEARQRGESLGVSVIYGDASDPEVLARLPLAQVRWVIFTPRDRELSVAMMHLLRDAGYTGRIVLTAASAKDVEILRAAGANEVLRPFTDAAEQAAEMLTGAVHMLPSFDDWPVLVREISLVVGSSFAGKTLGEISLRHATGVSVVAVSRLGALHLNPDPGFRVYPGDRLALLGDADSLDHAVEYLTDRQFSPEPEANALLAVEELEIETGSGLDGVSLKGARLRNEYGVTAISLCRAGVWSTTPDPEVNLKAGDRLLILGSREAVSRLRNRMNNQ